MANVARLDSKMRREFARNYFGRHPRATLTDANKELRKKFTRGMDMGSLREIKNRVLSHLAAQKKGTQPLGSQNIPEHVAVKREEQEALLSELKKTTEALAAVMASPNCPVFQIILSKSGSGQVEVRQSRVGTIVETETY